MLLGAHMSIAGGLSNAFGHGEKFDCDTIQIFTKSNNQWKAKELTDEDIEKYFDEQKRTGINPVVAHDSYLINLGSPDENLIKKSREAFLVELERCEKLKIPFLVTHPGSHLKIGEDWGISRIADSLDWVHERTEGYNVKVALETTAGQGSNLGYKFEQIATMIERTKYSDRLAVCMDTCHVFAAGYDISIESGYKKTMSEFNRIIGLDKLAVMHLNDSKKELGSRVDRHDHIGKGFIGEDAFGFIMRDKRLKKIPKLLETPKEDEMDRVNLGILKKLAAA
jgi:deoxyribonuclease-4